MGFLSFVIFVLLPPFLAGPLPTYLWLKMGSSPNWRWQLPVAALLAVALNLGAAALIVANLEGLVAAGFFACMLTPITALVTVLLSRISFRRGYLTQPENVIQRRWLQGGIVAIAVLQIGMVTTVVLIAPSLCTLGLRTCFD